MKLRDIAHARAGDKGDISNISVIAYRMEDFTFLRQRLTSQMVMSQLEGVVRGDVVRYELPALGALNFVLQDALAGGVTRSLALDAHGKCIAALLLDMEMLPSVNRPSAPID
jgi:hypothetical protein